MASHAAHRSTGWAAGLIAAAIVSHAGAGGAYHQWAVLTVLAGVAGGTAPDWMELCWWCTGKGRYAWIAHRTWTHWGLAWIAGLIVSYTNLKAHPGASAGLGFATGGLMHLLADWPNPLGVPWLFRQRHSLRWWNSGRCDWIIIVTVWCIAIVTIDHVWWHGTVANAALAMVRKVPPVVLSSKLPW